MIEDSVRCVQFEDIFLEHYYYISRGLTEISRHTHDEYQFGISVGKGGVFEYRGATHGIPARSLSIIHSGEPHTTREIEVKNTPSEYKMFYVPTATMHSVMSELSRIDKPDLPYFPETVLTDSYPLNLFNNLFDSLTGAATRLEKESLVLFAFSHLINRFAQNRPPMYSPVNSLSGLMRARDYLQDNYHKSISLEELGHVAGLSVSHFCLLFRRRFGVPPHEYQLHLRIDHAKKLLANGLSPLQTALETGFTHQSHFGRNFKRFVGTTPGKYGK